MYSWIQEAPPCATPITKIHFVRKAREGLWITAKVRRRKNMAVGRARLATAG
jgi:hypothetical protein